MGVQKRAGEVKLYSLACGAVPDGTMSRQQQQNDMRIQQWAAHHSSLLVGLPGWQVCTAGCYLWDS